MMEESIIVIVTPSPRHTQANVDFTQTLHTQYSNEREREKRAAGQQLHNDSTDLPITRLTGFTEQKSARDYTTSHNR